MQKRNLGSILVVILLIVGVYFVFFNHDSYIGFYYPKENDLTKHVQSSELSSLEDCRGWVETQEAKYNPSGSGYDYECGKNCKIPDYPDGLYVCEETLE